MFLTKTKTFPGGVIIVKKDLAQNSFSIIKALTSSTLNSSSSRIIGTLKKEGLLMRFSALDRSTKNITIKV